MSNEVYVIQVITTGPEGFPKDRVAEIGIASADLTNGDVRSVYVSRVGCGERPLSREEAEYLGSKAGIVPSDLDSAPPPGSVVAEVKAILKGKEVTSFEGSNTILKYLIPEPWDLTFEASVMPSVSSRLPHSLRCRVPSEENGLIPKAYDSIIGDAAPSDRDSALDLALKTAAIMVHLRRSGRY